MKTLQMSKKEYDEVSQRKARKQRLATAPKEERRRHWSKQNESSQLLLCRWALQDKLNESGREAFLATPRGFREEMPTSKSMSPEVATSFRRRSTDATKCLVARDRDG